MKKVFSIMVLSAVIAGMAWAQDEESNGTIKLAGGELTISGAAKMGVSVDGTTKKSPNSKGDVGTAAGIYFFSDDVGYDGFRGSAADAVGSRFDISFAYVNGPVGTKLTFRSNNFQNPGIRNAYGFVNLFGGKLNVTGGVINDAVWGSTMFGKTETDDSLTCVTGLRLAIAPVTGLSFGAAWDLMKITRNPDGTPVGKDLVAGPSGDSFYGQSITPGGFFGNTRFGIIYKNEAFGGASVELKLNGSHYAGKTTDPTDKKNVGYGADILYALQVTAIPKLTLTLDGYFDNIFVSASDLTDYSSSGAPKFNDWLLAFRGDFQVSDPLAVGLKLRFFGVGINSDKSEVKKANDTVYFDAKVFGYYDITQVINFGGEIGLAIDGVAKDTKDATGWTDKNSEFKKIWIKPKATFTLTEGLSFVVYDNISIIMANYWNNGYTDGTDKVGYVDNKFQLDFVWTF